jgi:hypothetical protein
MNKNKIIKNDILIKKIKENRKSIKPILRKIKKYKHILYYDDSIDFLHLKKYIYSGISIKIKNDIIIPNQNNLNDIFRLFIEKIIPHNYDSICNIEKEEINIILSQYKLKELYHSYNCSNNYCLEVNCVRTENLIFHVIFCENNDNCCYNDCATTKQLLLHHAECKLTNCECSICSPIIKLFSNK